MAESEKERRMSREEETGGLRPMTWGWNADQEYQVVV